MRRIYRSGVTPSGGVTSSAFGKFTRADQERRTASGLTMRGICLAVYYPTSLPVQPSVPLATNRNPFPAAFGSYVPPVDKSITCDVFVYSAIEGVPPRFVLSRVPVGRGGTGDTGGIHDGSSWVPRPSSFRIDEISVADPKVALDMMDGDHVLISFLDDDLRRPYVTGPADHPLVDRGSEDRAGTSIKVDGTATSTGTGPRVIPEEGTRPAFVRYKGVVFGVNDRGDFVVDVSRGNIGATDLSGREPRLSSEDPSVADEELPTDGSSGNVFLVLRNGARMIVDVAENPLDGASALRTQLVVEGGKLSVVHAGGDALEVTGGAGSAVLKVGSGDRHGVVAEALEALWGAVRSLNAHTHTVDGLAGITGPAGNVPAWNATSTKLLIPSE